MSTQAMWSGDTRLDAHREQVRLLREAGLTRRFQAARSLTHSMVELARGRVRKRLPEAEEAEVARVVARDLYGGQLLRELGVDVQDDT